MELVNPIFDGRYPTISQAFKTILAEEYALFARKSLDYGTNNVKAGASELNNPDDIQFSLLGIWFRIMDKVNRWKNLVLSGQEPQNESLLDTLQDIAVYATIAQIVARGWWIDKQPSDEKGTCSSSEGPGLG